MNATSEGESTEYLDISQAQEMKCLALEDHSEVNILVNITPSMDWSVGVCPLLESLKLSHLPNLQEICVGRIPKSSNSFGNLKELHLEKLPALEQLWESSHQNVSLANLISIRVRGCEKLRKLFSLLIAKNGLVKLETLEISGCGKMEHAFDEMDGEECHKITFPSLKKLELENLLSLLSFCKGCKIIEFPLLETISIHGCEKLKILISSAGDRNLANHDDSLHVFFNQEVIFGNLMEIDITKCHGIRVLFSSSTAVNLVKLEKLKITWCEEMIKVIEDDGNMLGENLHPFPYLKHLHFENLPKLLSFSKGKFVGWPLLESSKIIDCPLLSLHSRINPSAVEEEAAAEEEDEDKEEEEEEEEEEAIEENDEM